MLNRRSFRRGNTAPMNMVYRSKKHKTELWLGDYYAATDPQLLKSKGIRAVLTAATQLGISYPADLQINHKIINAYDMPSYKMTPHFEEVWNWMDDALSRGPILVHCAAGISRSTTCVLVYMMRQTAETEGLHLTFNQALQQVRMKRSIVNPNYGFQSELKKYELKLKKLIKPVSKQQETKVPQVQFHNMGSHFANKSNHEHVIGSELKKEISISEAQKSAVLNFINDKEGLSADNQKAHSFIKTVNQTATKNNRFINSSNYHYSGGMKSSQLPSSTYTAHSKLQRHSNNINKFSKPDTSGSYWGTGQIKIPVPKSGPFHTSLVESSVNKNNVLAGRRQTESLNKAPYQKPMLNSSSLQKRPRHSAGLSTSSLTNKFLTFKLENPRIVTIKK